MAAAHPMTMELLSVLAEVDDEGLSDAHLRSWANRVVDTPDGPTVGVELIALARRMAAVGANAIAAQVVLLAGLALGDSAGAQLKGAAESPSDAPAIPTFRPTQAPVDAVKGGPMARATVPAKLADPAQPQGSACPFHRVMDKVRRRRPAPL